MELTKRYNQETEKMRENTYTNGSSIFIKNNSHVYLSDAELSKKVPHWHRICIVTRLLLAILANTVCEEEKKVCAIYKHKTWNFLRKGDTFYKRFPLIAAGQIERIHI